MGQMFFKKKKEKLVCNSKSLFDIKATDIDGNELLLGDLAEGLKCIMVVNVASGWGYTDTHYKQMVEIHEEFKEQGFQIFAFPCNQFMGQESKCSLDIKKYAQEKKKATFQMFDKVEVNGENAHEVFKFCRRYSSLYNEKTGELQSIPWNFTKFLIDENGQVVGFYPPDKNPEDWVPQIKKMLGIV